MQLCDGSLYIARENVIASSEWKKKKNVQWRFKIKLFETIDILKTHNLSQDFSLDCSKKIPVDLVRYFPIVYPPSFLVVPLTISWIDYEIKLIHGRP